MPRVRRSPQLILTTSALALIAAAPTSLYAGDLSQIIFEPEVTQPCMERDLLRLRGGPMRVGEQPYGGKLNFIDEELGEGDGALNSKLDFTYEGGFVEGRYTAERCGYDFAIDGAFHQTSAAGRWSEEDDGKLEFTEVDDDVSFQTLDFEYGREISVGFRAHAGLRLMNYDSSTNWLYEERDFGDFQNIGFNSTTEFAGLGPHVGLGYTSPRSANGWGFFAGGSVAYLRGSGTHEIELISDSSPVDSLEFDHSGEVLMLEAELGVSRRIGTSGELSAGVVYKQMDAIDLGGYDTADEWEDVLSGAEADLPGGDRDFVGLFIGYETTF